MTFFPPTLMSSYPSPFLPLCPLTLLPSYPCTLFVCCPSALPLLLPCTLMPSSFCIPLTLCHPVTLPCLCPLTLQYFNPPVLVPSHHTVPTHFCFLILALSCPNVIWLLIASSPTPLYDFALNSLVPSYPCILLPSYPCILLPSMPLQPPALTSFCSRSHPCFLL